LVGHFLGPTDSEKLSILYVSIFLLQSFANTHVSQTHNTLLNTRFQNPQFDLQTNLFAFSYLVCGFPCQHLFCFPD